MEEMELEMFAGAAKPKDDAVLPFRMAGAGAGGRIVRLGRTVDEILSEPQLSRIRLRSCSARR